MTFDKWWKENATIMYRMDGVEFARHIYTCATLAEREECANMCEAIASCSYAGNAPTLRDVAKALRARSTK